MYIWSRTMRRQNCLVPPRQHLGKNESDFWPEFGTRAPEDPQDPDANYDPDAEYDPDQEMSSDTESLPDSQSSAELMGDPNDTAEDLEADHLLRTVGTSDADELDVYQLEVMVEVSRDDAMCEKWLPNWKVLLARKISAIEKEEKDNVTKSNEASGDGAYVDDDLDLEDHDADIYTPLIDLYILADRFDIRTLRSAVMVRLQVEHSEQLEILGGGPLSPYELVAEAYESLPNNSRLRRWMAAVYAARWTPAHDGPRKAVARDFLPKEFLMDIMSLQSERLFWTVPCYRPLELVDLCFYHEHETVEDVKNCRDARGLQDPVPALMKNYLGQY